jgi:hypothetical protein
VGILRTAFWGAGGILSASNHTNAAAERRTALFETPPLQQFGLTLVRLFLFADLSHIYQGDAVHIFEAGSIGSTIFFVRLSAVFFRCALCAAPAS